MNRADDLRSDYERLGELLHGDNADSKAAPAIARERRLIGELLEQLEVPKAVSLVDRLAGNVVALGAGRGAEAGAGRPASRRRKSG